MVHNHPTPRATPTAAASTRPHRGRASTTSPAACATPRTRTSSSATASPNSSRWCSPPSSTTATRSSCLRLIHLRGTGAVASPAAPRLAACATSPTAGTWTSRDIESKITPNTHALVVINPNNRPARSTAIVLKGLVDIARRHHLVLAADRIYEKIPYQDADGTMPVMHHVASFAGDDVLTSPSPVCPRPINTAATAPAGS